MRVVTRILLPVTMSALPEPRWFVASVSTPATRPARLRPMEQERLRLPSRASWMSQERPGSTYRRRSRLRGSTPTANCSTLHERSAAS